MKLFALLKGRDKKKHGSHVQDESNHAAMDAHPVAVLNKPVVSDSDVKSNQKTFNGFVLGKEQSLVVDILEKTKGNYFITGKAGSGKSTVLQYFVQHTKKKNYAIVAPTGIAALNVSGQTIHSFFKFGFGFMDVNDPGLLSSNLKDDTLEHLDVLIIDEISMVRADVMDMIDKKLRASKSEELPFGGCQVIAFGDLYQLPPVVKEDLESQLLQERYGTSYFFGAPAVQQTFTIIEMQEVFRQKEQFFVNMLNKIREATISEPELNYLNCASGLAEKPGSCTTLVLTNKAAEIINNERLMKLSGSEYEYKGEFDGLFTPQDDTPCDKVIRLREGALVLLVKNNREKGYVNGTIATITELDKDRIQIRFGKKIDVLEQETWEKYEYVYNEADDRIEKKVIGHFTQYPVKLAYAMTVHKSQGRTFDDICIDYMGKTAFSPGQTYVALSRCTSMEHMHLNSPISLADIRTNPEIIRYMRSAKAPEEVLN